MSPPSKNRTSFLEGLGLRRKKAEDPVIVKSPAPRRFKELSIYDAGELASAICCSRHSMSANRFQRVPTRDFDLISFRIHHLPDHLLASSTDTDKSKRFNQAEACQLHRKLSYELMDDVLYVLTRTMTKCARQYYSDLNDHRALNPDGTRQPLPRDVDRTFATLEKANGLISSLCNCPLERDDRTVPNAGQKKITTKKGNPSAPGSTPSSADSGRDETCCPACHLSTLSTNISFLIALRGFLLSYIPSRNHDVARRVSFVNGWIQHCSSSDRAKVRRASQSISDQINGVFAASRGAGRLRPSKSVRKRVEVVTHPGAASKAPSPKPHPSAPVQVARRRPVRRDVNAGDESTSSSSEDELFQDGSARLSSGIERETTHNSSGFTDHVDEAPDAEVHSYRSPKLSLTGRARRKMERRRTVSHGTHSVMLPDHPSDLNVNIPKRVPVAPSPPPAPVIHNAVPQLESTRPHRGFIVNDQPASPRTPSGSQNRYPSSYRARLPSSGHSRRVTIEKPSQAPPARASPAGGLRHDPFASTDSEEPELSVSHGSPHSSKKHDSVNEPLSPPVEYKKPAERVNVQQKPVSHVYKNPDYEQSLDDVYRVLSSMESLHGRQRVGAGSRRRMMGLHKSAGEALSR